MQVTIVGKEVVSYTNKSGQLKEGISLHYICPSPKVEGMASADLWIAKDNPMYSRLLAEVFSTPKEADIEYQVLPGSRFPSLVDIKIRPGK